MSKLIYYSLMALVMLIVSSVSAMEEDQSSKKQKKEHLFEKVNQKRRREPSRKEKKRKKKAQEKVFSLAVASILCPEVKYVNREGRGVSSDQIAALISLTESLSVIGGEVLERNMQYGEDVKRKKTSAYRTNQKLNPLSAKRKQNVGEVSLKRRRVVKNDSFEEEGGSSDDVKSDLNDLLALAEKKHKERGDSDEDEEEGNSGIKRRTYESIPGSERPNKFTALNEEDNEEEEECADAGSIKRKRYDDFDDDTGGPDKQSKFAAFD